MVLACLPRKEDAEEYGADTLFPEGVENVPPRYAIDRRNRWMIDKADYVVTYVSTPSGGAAKFKMLAEKKRKDNIRARGIVVGFMRRKKSRRCQKH